MKEKMLSILLIIAEAITVLLLCLILGIPFNTSSRLMLLWVIIFLLSHHYTIHATLVWDEIIKILNGMLAFCLLEFIFLYPRWTLIFKCLGVAILMGAFSLVLNRTIRVKFRNAIGRKTLVVGMGADALRIAQIAGRNRFAITRIVGLVSENENLVDRDELPLHKKSMKLYKYSELDKALNELEIDQVIIAIPNASKEKMDEVSKKLFDKVKNIKVVPNELVK